jgi:hypothetical protein
MTIVFKGAAKPLSEGGLLAAAAGIDVSARALRAVIQVETNGHGFDDKGRLRMLYEPAQFYKRVRKDGQARAITLGLAKASMKGASYPRDSYPSLAGAMIIDETAALESASFGLPQIMGFNHELAGFASAAAMIAAMVDSEDAQVMAMARFLKGTGLDKALRNGQWATFAKGYNGVNYRDNAYDTKLAAAYAAIRPDAVPLSKTPATPVPVAAGVPASLTERLAVAAPLPAIPPKAAQGPAHGFWATLAAAITSALHKPAPVTPT